MQTTDAQLSTEDQTRIALQENARVRELAGYTLIQLREIADDEDISLPARGSKAGIIDEIARVERVRQERAGIETLKTKAAIDAGFATKEEAWEYRYRSERLNEAVAAGKAAEAKLADHVAEQGILRTLTWGARFADTAAKAELAAKVLRVAELIQTRENDPEPNPCLALRQATDSVCAQPLLRNEWNGGSTSAFSNAVEDSMRVAAAEIARGF